MAVGSLRKNCWSAVLAAALMSACAHQGMAADEPGARFSMTPSGDGFVRLDKQTGAVSMCDKDDGEWACKTLPDDQKALQDRIGKLEQENQSLKQENRRLEEVMGLHPDAAKPGPGGGPANGTQPPRSGPTIPSEKDVDKAFDYVEGMLKKFRDRLKKLDEEMTPPPGTEPRFPPDLPGDPAKPAKPGSTTPL